MIKAVDLLTCFMKKKWCKRILLNDLEKREVGRITGSGVMGSYAGRP